MHNIDDALNEIGLNVGKGTRFKQWLAPVNPSVYRGALGRLKKKLGV